MKTINFLLGLSVIFTIITGVAAMYVVEMTPIAVLFFVSTCVLYDKQMNGAKITDNLKRAGKIIALFIRIFWIDVLGFVVYLTFLYVGFYMLFGKLGLLIAIIGILLLFLSSWFFNSVYKTTKSDLRWFKFYYSEII